MIVKKKNSRDKFKLRFWYQNIVMYPILLQVTVYIIITGWYYMFVWIWSLCNKDISSNNKDKKRQEKLKEKMQYKTSTAEIVVWRKRISGKRTNSSPFSKSFLAEMLFFCNHNTWRFAIPCPKCVSFVDSSTCSVFPLEYVF